MDQWILPSAKAADGQERAVNRTEAFDFINPAGVAERFGAGDYDDPAKVAEAGLTVLHETEFDPAMYVSTGFADTLQADGSVLREHTLAPRYTQEELLEQAAAHRVEEIKARLTQIDREHGHRYLRDMALAANTLHPRARKALEAAEAEAAALRLERGTLAAG
jgi:hypothetical protein